VRRRQYVVALVHDRLERVWTSEEPDGDAWSTVAPVGDSAGVHRLWHYMVIPSEEDGPEQVAVRALAWDGRRLVPASDGPGVPPLSGVVADSVRTPAAAQAVRSRHRECLGGFRVVPPSAATGGAALVAITPSPALAAKVRDRVADCAAEVRPRVATLGPSFVIGGD
jgi:hypothetical protein